MRCPDCKVEMDAVTTMCNELENTFTKCEIYWKCPKCLIEVEND